MSNGAGGVQTDFRHLGAARTADSEYNGNALEEARASADAASLLRCAKEWVFAGLEQREHGVSEIERKGALEPTATWLGEHGEGNDGRRKERGESERDGVMEKKKAEREESSRGRQSEGMKRQIGRTETDVDS